MMSNKYNKYTTVTLLLYILLLFPLFSHTFETTQDNSNNNSNDSKNNKEINNNNSNNKQPLKFNKEGKFKIVQFTDLHYGYNEYENDMTAKVQERILQEENPDLVIITGDLISGYEWDRSRGGWIHYLWKKLISPMEKYNTRWAIALGNHDVEGDLSGIEIAEMDSAHKLSYTQVGPSTISGATNYYLPVYSFDSTNYTDNDIGQLLWVFDSGNSGCLGVRGWGCIMNDQVEWYRNASRYFTETRSYGRYSPHPIPSLAFFHIPLYEHLDLWNAHGVQGDLGEGEGVCCSAVNTGMYAAMKQMGDVKGVYCGHDHSNDYIGDYHGINLGFGRKTGYGCYGPPMGWKHGARVLEISHNEFGARTWLRLEDGSVEIQKHHSVSWRKFLGCCSMEGHGRVAMTWLNLLALFAYVFVFVLIVSLCIRYSFRYYRNRRGKPIIGVGGKDYENEDEDGNSGLLHTWELQKLTHFWAAKAPRPRQRRVNELDSV